MKKIGVLTSGGDSQGMTAAVKAVVKSGEKKGLEVYGIEKGYYGLYHGLISKLSTSEGDIRGGGTFLRSARFPEFAEEEVRKEAIKQLDKHGIEALIVIGGDGSFMGAKRLSEMGYPCIGIPGTIDNDTPSSDFTIGFDSALNIIVNAADSLVDTGYSHQRCSVLEVMGRNAGDLALWSAIASEADFVLIPEIKATTEDVINTINRKNKKGQESFLVIVAEGIGNSKELTKEIEEKTGVESRLTVLGHIQRGGTPTAFDRVLASRMGVYAVELLLEGKSERCIGISENKLVDDDIMTALSKEHTVDEKLYELANDILNI